MTHLDLISSCVGCFIILSGHFDISCSRQLNYIVPSEIISSMSPIMFPPLELEFLKSFPLWHLDIMFPSLELQFLLQSFPLWHLYCISLVPDPWTIVPAEVISSLAPLCLFSLHLNYSSCWSHFLFGTFVSLVPSTWTIVPAEIISSLEPLCLLFPRLKLQFLLKSFPLRHLCVSCSRHLNYSSCWSHFLSGTFVSLVLATWTIVPAKIISSPAPLCLLFSPLEL